jgi:hypothetical protein
MHSYDESEDTLNSKLYMFIFLVFAFLFVKAIFS